MTTSYNVPVGLYNETDFTPPTGNCHHPEHFHTYDAQGTEVEVIDMVFGLIRGCQPDIVLETGTSRGFLARRINDALVENGHGELHTYEPDPPTVEEAQERLSACHTVHLHAEPSMVPWEYGQIDFAWFDSLLELRWPEFDYYHQFMSSTTLVGFHDTDWRFGAWAEQVRRDPRIAVIDMPTPRGCIIGRVR